MRILMISKACVVGAYQRKLEELARLPAVELTVVVPPFWRDARGTLRLERAHTEGYELQVLPMRFNGHFHIHHYVGLGRVFRQVHPHLVHVDEEPYNLATFQATRWAQRVGARTIFFTWQNLCRRYPPPFSWMERYVHRAADHALAGNQEAARVLRRKGYRGPITVLPQFGVDPDLFAPAGESSTRPFTVGFAGRLVVEKGVDLLLRAVAGLEGMWRARLLGEGPMRERLRTLAEELGIAEQVTFEPPRPSTEMPAWYQGLDVLVLPSRTRPNWKEQFGRVLVEAMACGVPVVGAESGEIPHVIGDAGLIFPEGDAEALRENLARLQQDPGLRQRLARAGRERVLVHFTQARIAARTWEVYREVLGAASP